MAEVTGRLEHPGIVPVYGMGADEQGRPYYAMRFVRGESLLAALTRFLDLGHDLGAGGTRQVLQLGLELVVRLLGQPGDVVAGLGHRCSSSVLGLLLTWCCLSSVLLPGSGSFQLVPDALNALPTACACADGRNHERNNYRRRPGEG